MGEVLLDALLDSVKIFPFLFLMYLIIEILEHRTKVSRSSNVLRGGLAPLLGAAVGIIPQCGFSVMAAKLYDRRLIRTGTLLAVFLATSDEALILLLTSGTEAAIALMPLIAVKFAVAVGVGYAANGVCRGERLADLPEGEEVHGNACGHDHEGEGDPPVKRYVVHPLLHSLQIFAYLLAVNIAFGVLIYYVGEANIAAFLDSTLWLQPLIAALVGLIPNCASSVLITGAYIGGYLSFGAMAAGLCVNAGLGFVVLFKNVKRWRRNLLLLAVLFAIGTVVGYAATGVMQLFAL